MIHDKKFFDELKEKLYKDLEEFYAYKKNDSKRRGLLNDIHEDLSYYTKELQNKVVVDESLNRRITTEDRDNVKKFAIKNNYPQIELSKNKYMGSGQKSWENAMIWNDLAEPYKSNFLELVVAVENYGKANGTR